jgi:YidC/Oxa1 family membrane protein insertase
MSDQKRVIIASALSLLVIVVWSFFYRPAGPPPGTVLLPAVANVSAPNMPAASAAHVAPGAPNAAPGAATAAVVADAAERSIVVESDLYRVVLSNRGAVVRSWQLKKYDDAHKPRRTLDVVNGEVAQQIGNWPFSLQMSDAQDEAAVNQGLYVVTTASGATSTGTTLTAPAEVAYQWSDGQLTVTKRLKFDRSYVVQLETSVQRGGQPVTHRVAWRGGFGDVAAFRAALQSLVFSDTAGSVTTIATKGLGVSGQPGTAADQAGSFDVAGIEDLFFAAAFLPPAPPPGLPVPAVVTLSTRQLVQTVQQDGKAQQVVLPEMAAGSTSAGPLNLRVFVGPKDLDVLKAIQPPLDHLVQYGWFGLIAEPLFYILRWLYRYVPNYGWAIVLLTLAINTLLYPLKLKGWRSMQRMQKVAPEIRSIQDRYKKYSMRDPRKQEMNKEVMAVYGREGINPLGSCLPQVAQMPIWFGLYRMLANTIELRHAPWIGWIHDLSARDPYYILPVSWPSPCISCRR